MSRTAWQWICINQMYEYHGTWHLVSHNVFIPNVGTSTMTSTRYALTNCDINHYRDNTRGEKVNSRKETTSERFFFLEKSAGALPNHIAEIRTKSLFTGATQQLQDQPKSSSTTLTKARALAAEAILIKPATTRKERSKRVYSKFFVLRFFLLTRWWNQVVSRAPA